MAMSKRNPSFRRDLGLEVTTWSPIQRRSSKRMRRRDQRLNPHGISSTRISWSLPMTGAQIQLVIISVACVLLRTSGRYATTNLKYHLNQTPGSVSPHRDPINHTALRNRTTWGRRKKFVAHLVGAGNIGVRLRAGSGLRKFRLSCVTSGESYYW